MATAITRDFTQPLAPRQRVTDYIAGLGNLTQGLPAQTDPNAVQESPVQIAAAQSPLASGSAVQMSAQRRTDAISATNARLKALTDAATRQRAQAGGGEAGMGRAYTPDGNLSAARNKALGIASSYLGTRYVLGGTSHKGIDCSGLVMMVYNQLGYNINRHSATWQGKNIPGVRTSLNNLRPGDIVAWKDGSHIAIYAGNGEIIEAANPRVGTVRRKLWASPSAVYGIALRLPGE